MISPELFIILINICIVVFAYSWLFPRVAGSDLKKVSLYDFLASIVSVSIAGFFFFGLNIEFNAVLATMDWFWFALLSYVLIEIPMAFWYMRKYRVWDGA